MDTREALRKRLLKKAKEKVKEEHAGREAHTIKAVNLLEDLDNVFNLLAEQTREWYALHFPELNQCVKDNELFLKLVLLGEKKNFSEKNVFSAYGSPEQAEKISKLAINSMGAELEKGDLARIQGISESALALKKERDLLANYISGQMKKELPHFTELAEPILGAKILSKMGSARKLAFLPSSAIQVIGAEKALFSHIKKGTKPPKHGLLFNHPMVKKMRPWNKGKIARSLAAKLSLAAKQDYFKGKGKESAQQGLDKRVKEIIERKPKKRKEIEAKPEEKKFSIKEKRFPAKEKRFSGKKRQWKVKKKSK